MSMVMIPLFADQYRNSRMLEYRKMAVVLDRKQLSVEKLTDAIKTVINNPSYRQNAKRIAALIEAKPMSSAERFVKYTEFAAKFGNDINLDIEGRHLNFWQFYCLDIIIPAILFVVLYFLYIVVKVVVKKIWGLIELQNKIKRD